MKNTKTHFWLAGIQISAVMFFFSLFFASEEIAFGNLRYYQVIAYVAFAIFSVCTAIGTMAAVSRRLAKKSAHDEDAPLSSPTSTTDFTDTTDSPGSTRSAGFSASKALKSLTSLFKQKAKDAAPSAGNKSTSSSVSS